MVYFTGAHLLTPKCTILQLKFQAFLGDTLEARTTLAEMGNPSHMHYLEQEKHKMCVTELMSDVNVTNCKTLKFILHCLT